VCDLAFPRLMRSSAASSVAPTPRNNVEREQTESAARE
jgi:hypothetical protein